MASIKHPLLGDPFYGAPQTSVQSALRKAGYDAQIIAAVHAFPRQALHAHKIAFIHPVTGQGHSYEAPLPPDMQDLINLLRAGG